MPFAYIAEEVWRWFADTGINVVLLILLAFLVPRAGRFANRFMQRRVRSAADPNEGKSHLAISGVVVYVVQLTAYFLIFVFLLQQLGFSLAGAAIPATVVSAAIGFGAQSIIADFLAGFFILTEKQFGVGDHVEFQGNGLDIEGDVIQITMRATTIRTLNQATVTIPNSAARIYINQSNYWVNAVVVMPIPLIGSDSAAHAIERSERAARRALVDPEIASKLLGELQIHPAVEVNPPTAAGLPWTVDMRFMVRVEPLSQWMVERAIRIAVLDEFWGEYGDASKQFLLADAASAETSHSTHHRLPRRLTWAAAHRGDDPDAAPAATPGPAAELETEIIPARPARAASAGGPAGGGASDGGATSGGAPGDSAAGVDPAVRDPAAPHPDGAVDAVDAADAEAAQAGGPQADAAETEAAPEPRTVFGGAMRASTLALIIAFLVALLVRGMMLVPGEDTDASGGVLAPPARTPASSRETVVPTTESAPAPASPTETTESTEPGAGAATATWSTSPGETPGESTQDSSPAGTETPSATRSAEPTVPSREGTAPAPASPGGSANNPGGGATHGNNTANPAPAPAASLGTPGAAAGLGI